MPKQLTPEDLAKSGTEHAAQAALFFWRALPEQRERFPELMLMFAVPNGGERNIAVAGRMKAEGVQAGVPDIMLPVARHNCHGLFLELKKPSVGNKKAGKTTEKQEKWIDNLRLQGYGACVVFGWEAARDVLVKYLS